MGFPIKFLRDDHFGSPITDFLNALPDKQRAKALKIFATVEGPGRIPSSYLQKLANTRGIWEIRVEFGGNLQRYLGIFHDGQLLLLHAFVKKTQKTPAREIELAETRARQYLLKQATHG